MIKKYIVLSQGWDGCPLAYHLKREGFDVVLGQVQDKGPELKNGDKAEDPKEKEQRLSQYDGMLTKVPARKLVDALKKVSNKDEYFVFCDQNSLWAYAEELVKAGFTNGLFPTKENFEFEKSRELAMKFVEENYKGIKIIPYQEFSKVEDGKKFMQENPGPYVLQSKGDHVSTVVCTSDEPNAAVAQLSNQLDKCRAEYEKGGFILKTKLIDPVEITPQAVFYDGELAFTDLDIETKNIGDGQNNGNQVGCGSNLIIRTDVEEPINKIAFPKVVYDMAKRHAGLFVWDISLYITPEGIYFGEFCSNRLGYDACMTEACMSGGVGKYFGAIVEGKNPLKAKFGTAVRMFNLNRQEGVEIAYEGVEESVYLYEVTEKDGKQVSVGDCWDLGVVVQCGETIETAVEKLYETVGKVVFKEMYCRTKRDFLSLYPTSILDRYGKINHDWIEGPDVGEVALMRERIYAELKAEMEADKNRQVSEIKEAVRKIVYGTTEETAA